MLARRRIQIYDGGKLYILYNILADKIREAVFYKGLFIMVNERNIPRTAFLCITRSLLGFI